MDQLNKNDLLTQEGYFDRFFEIIADKNVGSYREAYELLEAEHYQAFNQNRYNSYDSFRVMKNRYLNNLRRKANEQQKV